MMSKRSNRVINSAPTNTTDTNMENQTQNDATATQQTNLPAGDTTDININGNDSVSGANDNAGATDQEESTTIQNQAPLVVEGGISDKSAEQNDDVKQLSALVDSAVDTTDTAFKAIQAAEEASFVETIQLTTTSATNTVETPVKTPKVYAFGSIILDSAFKNLDLYITAMGPNCINDEQAGGRHQRSLRQSLLAIINNADETNYIAAFDSMFAMLDENSSFVFHEYNRFRFHDTMGLSAGEFNTWSRLLTGLILLSNAKSRPVVSKQVNIADMLNEARLSASGNNLLSSYLGA